VLISFGGIIGNRTPNINNQVERPHQLISSKSNLVWQKFLIIIITICSESQHFIFTNIIFMGPLRLSLLLVMRRLAKAAGSRRSLPPPSSARWSSLVGVAELGVGVDLDGDERWGTVGKKRGGRREKRMQILYSLRPKNNVILEILGQIIKEVK
jgi:hypothetical protein